MKVTYLVGMTLALLSTQAIAAYTDAGGRIWRDVNETEGLSWNQIDSVCANDGVTTCSGSVAGIKGSVEFTGWTWATRDQVRDLFEELTFGAGIPPCNPDLSDDQEISAGSCWAPLANARMTPSSTWDSFATLISWTATEYGSGSAYFAYITDYFDPSAVDYLRLWMSVPKAEQYPEQGAWLFKQSSVVPLPAAGWLLLSGLAGLGVLGRRRNAA